MNYSTFHGANSVNTFNMLLDDYVAGQLNDFDEEIATIFTKKRQIEKNEVSLVYPNEIFNYIQYGGFYGISVPNIKIEYSKMSHFDHGLIY